MASFDSFLPLLLQVEGGYQNNENDSGNYNSLGQLVGTNHGISAETYESWIKRPPSVSDMKNILRGTAIQIYKAWFWNKMKGDYIASQSVANILIDHGVNAGTSRAGKMVQQILNDTFGKSLLVDGVIGNKTIAEINSVNPQSLFNEIKQERTAHYYALGGTFLTGWLKRLKQFVFADKKKV